MPKQAEDYIWWLAMSWPPQCTSRVPLFMALVTPLRPPKLRSWGRLGTLQPIHPVLLYFTWGVKRMDEWTKEQIVDGKDAGIEGWTNCALRALGFLSELVHGPIYSVNQKNQRFSNQLISQSRDGQTTARPNDMMDVSILQATQHMHGWGVEL